jgi:hypothetical protein
MKKCQPYREDGGGGDAVLVLVHGAEHEPDGLLGVAVQVACESKL